MKPQSETVIEYHQKTKHYPGRYARGPGRLDWENEPDPFRRYEGAERFGLPLLKEDPAADHYDLYARKRNQIQAFSASSVGAFLELSMGLSAWKSYGGSSWALRMNPSSGNLHPTEAYLILPPIRGLPGGIFHYHPYHHALEQRAVLEEGRGLGPLGLVPWETIKGHFKADGFFVALSSICWREAWKYGERAFRYCQQDIGHATACMSFSANLMGWKLTYLNAASDEQVSILLGFDRTRWPRSEPERPGPIFFVHANTETEIPKDIPQKTIEHFKILNFAGVPNTLSRGHMPWHVIDEVASATEKPATPAENFTYEDREYVEKDATSIKAAAIIRQRRSALAFDRKTGCAKEELFAMLDKCIPRSRCAPFDAALGEISVHLLLFIHRVKGLTPGLYFLLRKAEDLEEIKRSCNPGLRWERVGEAPEGLLLYLLDKGDFTRRAVLAGCEQEIAGDGVFSAAMIGRFSDLIEHEPWRYRLSHWEAGMIGQVLYLEAEAHGLRGTGMGCFFDDVTHEVLGITGDKWQDIYHFAMGKPLEDKRLATQPPYHHLKR